MNVLIVAEMPSITRCIAPFARRHWPGACITFVHAVPYGNLKFSYPRGLKLDEFPYLSEPRDRLAAWDEWACPPAILSADGTLSPVAMSADLFTPADVIVAACGSDHTGAVAFDVLMRQVYGDDRAKDCPTLTLCSVDDASIEKGFANLQPFGEVSARHLEYGRVKRYFDWNWNVNSLAILGEAQRRAGVPADAPPLSKYALQLLYGLRNHRPMTEGRVASLMQHWLGTGRYKTGPGEWRPRLGSSASTLQIMDNLVAAGLLVRGIVAGRSHLGLSGHGRTLLNLLHPDCEDADLPFRLNAWCEQGLASKPVVDRYINTFFGKQKSFLAR
ncbi:hypothetical protein WJ96_05515 [Burkholderia ubonensis]|uniref:HTH marR-type domain-containing protein n=1 Tax=Burkholderia ubonensis TaxID=101571 RepID=A0AAW3MR35_9BURK|nr:hypothetical protein [Burkholderia ubonensis]KVP75216.1 hypothetical protein WJ93_07310 [Burkholderia ubonensis]KVP96686.1 hypothetical protein WJ97_12445 [Burkholderia ubonensis]KVP98029.1 hypothetical protein WJ96_05515 [Burkholderia ubonensis]KVZ92726.1 hypothetical protein WL25_17175 [Burkholderia ubonensis]